MIFSKSRPVKIVLVGTGGTGGYIVPQLYRLLYALDRPIRVRLGLRSSDKDKVCALPGTGGFCRKSDLPALKGMFARHHRELQEAIGADPTGRGFIYEMFRTELSNHEYAYTQDVSETLDCLGITQQMLEAVPQLQTGLALACRSLLKHA